MASIEWTKLDDDAVKVAKALAADAVEKVGNGHPGTAISLAPVAYLLYQKHLRHNPKDTFWPGRDRFILSIGHSSLTQYIQLFLSGAGVELDDLKSFRTYGSLTPGHPEYKHTKGVEITTGPLGHGLASAVGFAYSQRYERGLFDPDAAPGTSPFDHNIFVIAGDGDLQEGVTSEAASLAGLQKLGNIIVIWDDNHISIEGDTNIAFTEDVLKRYEAYGWHTQRVDWTNGGTEYKEDVTTLNDAIDLAKAETGKPSIISLRTLIAWPTPNKTNDASSHGSALGTANVAGLKEVLGFNPNDSFIVPDEVLEHTRKVAQKGAKLQDEWNQKFAKFRAENPGNARLFDRLYADELPNGWEKAIPSFPAGESIATRSSSGKVINALAEVLPEFWGGSADLGGSNNTTISGAKSFAPEENSTGSWQTSPYGRVLHFGIREHAMGQIINGIVLSGKTRAFGGTFFQFADFMRDSARIAALQGIPSIFVWSHDSIAVGEDGPTHQPIEHLTAMRAIPGLDIVRPADANEVAVAWREIIKIKDRPVGLILSRQNLPTFPRDGEYTSAEGVAKGGYILLDAPSGKSDVILIATGSEVQIAVEAREMLASSGINARVVSMPSIEWFEQQSDEYKESVLPKSVKARVTIEAGIALSWYKYLGDAGVPVSIEHFGASGAPAILYKEFGISVDATVEAAKKSIAIAK
ncbi:MAG: transketolase [Candidatus Ancillula sp.]|nr:transketolase [Candidatus Ancillula sp.]